MHSSSSVGSVVNERGVKVLDGVVGSATTKHFGVLRSLVDPVFKVEFGDLFIDFLVDVRVCNWAFAYSVAILTCQIK